MDSGSMMAYKRIVPRGVTLITFTIQGDTVAPMDAESYNTALMKLQAVEGSPTPIQAEADFLNEWLNKYDAAQKKEKETEQKEPEKPKEPEEPKEQKPKQEPHKSSFR